jgi:hypothetical protein
VLVYVMLPATLMLSAALTYGSHHPEGFSTHPLVIVVLLTSSTSWLLQLYGATRCMRLTRREPVTTRLKDAVTA